VIRKARLYIGSSSIHVVIHVIYKLSGDIADPVNVDGSVIIPDSSEPHVRTLRAIIPENESH
jgi:hypothetical protein